MKQAQFKVNLMGLLVAGFLTGSTAHAVNMGIVDSGVDLEKQPLLTAHAWTNPGKTEGYENDLHGWNFAENNNQIIDYSFLGSFSPDTTKFFEVQLRVIEGNATDEDKAWIETKKKDPKFIEELSTFANFMHGTHVAGIASKGAAQAKVMGAKIIPTKIKPAAASAVSAVRASTVRGMGPMDDILMKGALGMIAGRQTEALAKVGDYLAKTKMKVANCSFGTGNQQATMIAKMIGKMLLQRELTDAETATYATYFMSQVIEKGAAFVNASKATLFVIAAGNDGSDNDAKPVFPANVKTENTITVAATRGADRLAVFSNYGATKVEIAAPGVGIRSTLPGGGEMAVSGTSQAAPFVANVAGKVMDANPNLSLVQVKQILMSTVDKKPFLVGKVVSEGIANEERAVRAAHLSATVSLTQAIAQANMDLPQAMSLDAFEEDSSDTGFDGYAVPLTPLFQ